MTPRVLLLSRHGRLASTSRLRMFQYVPALEAHGVEVTTVPLLSDDYLQNFYEGRRTGRAEIAAAYARRLLDLLRARRYDLVWTQYELLPWLPAWGERLLNLMGVPYAVDYDDAIFHRYDQHPRRIVRTLLGGKIDTVMRCAALVTAGNEYLMDRARQAGARRVEYLPTVVDLDRYPVAPPQQGPEFRIGWVGSPVTAKYLELVRPALQAISERAPVRLVIVGSGPVTLPGLPIEIHPWDESTEVPLIQSFDVGIMPLPDDHWERGKSGYKLIQYMACGRPVIASPVGVNRQIVRHGQNGFVAESLPAWIDALESLRQNPDLRAQMGHVGRAMVEADYCLQVTAPRLVDLLRAAVTRS